MQDHLREILPAWRRLVAASVPRQPRTPCGGLVELGAIGVLGILPQRQACETGGIMAITRIRSARVLARETRQALFNFSRA